MLFSSYTNNLIEAGCDEVGLGSIAGPIVAATVILPKGYTHPILNDSKRIHKSRHHDLAEQIKADAIDWRVCFATQDEILKHNPVNASYLAIYRCLENLTIKPQLILMDGIRFKPNGFTPYKCIIKGDSRYLSIAAASILSKSYRDMIMKEYANQYPEYGWEKNAGYPTKSHKLAIKEFGFTPLHRLNCKIKL